MLTTTEIKEIREKLEQSQNPLFLFDNDVDGLCSFVILQRALGRGKGVAVKSFPNLDKSYLRKINELNPDAIFILDKPQVEADFIEGVYEKNLPLIWIDHHEVPIDKKLLKKISYYNSFPSSEPVTYLAQKIFNRKEDLWVAMIGCIGDVYMPEFAEQFAKENPELFPEKAAEAEAFSALYTTEIGKIIKMLNFGLKDTTTNVLKLIRLIIKAKSPHDILEENYHTRPLHKRYNEINKLYQKLLAKAESQINKKLIFFTYSGNMSISSEVANEIFFKHKDKFIVIAYQRPGKVNISIRGQNAKTITEKVIKKIEGGVGGGHELATGAQIPSDELDNFKKQIEKLVK